MERWIVDTTAGAVLADWPGYDAFYAGLELAMAGAKTLTDDLTIDCYGETADTTAVTVDGWTVGSYTLTIQQHSDHAHGGVWSDSKYRLDFGSSYYRGLSISNDCVVDGLQITGADNYRDLIYMANNVIILKNLFVLDADNGQTTDYRGIYCAAGTHEIHNTIVKGFSNSIRKAASYGPTLKVYDTTIDTTLGIGFAVTNNVDIEAYRCISIASNAAYENSTGDYNVSSDATAPGTNVVHNYSGAATLFPNANDYRPAVSYMSQFTTFGAGAIPWERSVVVDTDGTTGDYASLSLAEAGEQTNGADLALRNEKLTINCQASTSAADTTEVAVAGYTTSAVNDLTISGDGWDGDYELLFTSDWQEALDVLIDNILVENMRVTTTQINSRAIDLEGDNVNTVVRRCRLTGPGAGATSYSRAIQTSTFNGQILDNLCVGFGRGVFINRWTILHEGLVANNTTDCVVAGVSANVPSGNSLQVINNIAVNATDDYVGDFSDLLSASNNISSDATGSAGLQNQTAASLFNDPNNGDYTLKAGSAAIGAGTRLAHVFTDDILGATRYGWDIGAFEWDGVYQVNTDSQTNGEYASLSAAVAALPATLDRPTTISCSGTTADTTAVTISGITTTAIKDLTVQGDGWDGSYYLNYDGVDNYRTVLGSSINHITIKDLRVSHTGTGTSGGYGINLQGSGGVAVVSGCHVDSTGTTVDGISFHNMVGGSSTHIFNNLITGGGHGIYSSNRWTTSVTQTGYIYNNTVHGVTDTGIYCRINTGYGAMYALNNVSINVSGDSDFFVDVDGQEDFNISSDSTATGANSHTLETAASLFNDPTNGDYRIKDTGAAYNAGTDLSAYFTDDITGATRTQWDIGAFLYVDLGGGDSLSVNPVTSTITLTTPSTTSTYSILTDTLTSNTSISSVLLSTGVSLLLDSLASATITTAPTISFKVSLLLDNLQTASTLGDIALVSKYLLELSDLTTLTSAEQTAVSFAATLALSTLQSQTQTTSPTIATGLSLLLNNLLSTSESTTPTLEAAYTISVEDAASSATLDSAIISSAIHLLLNPVVTTTSTISVDSLTTKYTLALENAVSTAALTAVNLGSWVSLVIDNLSSTTELIDSLDISKGFLLTVDNLDQTAIIDNTTIGSPEFSLLVDELTTDSSISAVSVVLPTDGCVLLINAKTKNYTIDFKRFNKFYFTKE